MEPAAAAAAASDPEDGHYGDDEEVAPSGATKECMECHEVRSSQRVVGSNVGHHGRPCMLCDGAAAAAAAPAWRMVLLGDDKCSRLNFLLQISNTARSRQLPMGLLAKECRQSSSSSALRRLNERKTTPASAAPTLLDQQPHHLNTVQSN